MLLLVLQSQLSRGKGHTCVTVSSTNTLTRADYVALAIAGSALVKAKPLY